MARDSFLGVLRRHWLGGMVGLLVTAVMSVFAYVAVAPSFKSEAIVVLVPPLLGSTDTGPDGEESNPLLMFDSSLSTTALVLVRSLDSEEVQATVGVNSADGSVLEVSDGSLLNPNDFQVVRPFVIINAEARSPDKAIEIVNRTMDRVRDDLRARQEQLRAPPSTYIGFEVVVAPTIPVVDRGSQITAALVLLAVGLVCSLLLMFALDSLRRPLRSGGPLGAKAVAPEVPLAGRDGAQAGGDSSSGRSTTSMLNSPTHRMTYRRADDS